MSRIAEIKAELRASLDAEGYYSVKIPGTGYLVNASAPNYQFLNIFDTEDYKNSNLCQLVTFCGKTNGREACLQDFVDYWRAAVTEINAANPNHIRLFVNQDGVMPMLVAKGDGSDRSGFAAPTEVEQLANVKQFYGYLTRTTKGGLACKGIPLVAPPMPPAPVRRPAGPPPVRPSAAVAAARRDWAVARAARGGDAPPVPARRPAAAAAAAEYDWAAARGGRDGYAWDAPAPAAVAAAAATECVHNYRTCYTREVGGKRVRCASPRAKRTEVRQRKCASPRRKSRSRSRSPKRDGKTVYTAEDGRKYTRTQIKTGEYKGQYRRVYV